MPVSTKPGRIALMVVACWARRVGAGERVRPMSWDDGVSVVSGEEGGGRGGEG